MKENCYKVVEEHMSQSGRVEYTTLPLYVQITEDEINGKVPFKKKPSIRESMLKKWGIEIAVNANHDCEYIHAFSDYDTAVEYVKKYFKGYTYTRPAIFLCECNGVSDEYLGILKCESVKFIKPISFLYNFNLCDYVPIQKPEKKKTSRMIFDESEINGDVDILDEQF